jgi:hypothetical protein
MLNQSYWKLHPQYSKLLVLNCEENWNGQEGKKDGQGTKKEGKKDDHKHGDAYIYIRV